MENERTNECINERATELNQFGDVGGVTGVVVVGVEGDGEELQL